MLCLTIHDKKMTRIPLPSSSSSTRYSLLSCSSSPPRRLASPASLKSPRHHHPALSLRRTRHRALPPPKHANFPPRSRRPSSSPAVLDWRRAEIHPGSDRFLLSVTNPYLLLLLFLLVLQFSYGTLRRAIWNRNLFCSSWDGCSSSSIMLRIWLLRAANGI